MPALVATAGAVNANVYCTLNYADTYFEEFRLHDSAWGSATDDDKEVALLWATRLLDELCNWNGTKATDTQALRWPRSHLYTPDSQSLANDSIPDIIQQATAEFAFHLLSEDRTIETGRDLTGFEKLKVGPIYMQLDQYSKKPVMPPSVWSKVKFYATRYGRYKELVRM